MFPHQAGSSDNKAPQEITFVVEDLLLFAMACSICIRQISSDSEIQIRDIQVIQRSSSNNCVDLSELPFAHYPKPETFDRRRDNASSILKISDMVYNVDLLTSASKNECTAAAGFKWMLNQGLMECHEDIAEYLNRRGVSVSFLFRRNLLRQLVSVLANAHNRYAKLLNGTHKSHVHTVEEARALSKYQPLINSSSFVSDLQQMQI